MAHQAGAYPGFSSMKRLGVFLLPPGWDASPSQGYPQHQIRRYPFIYLGGERHCESKVSCPRTQHNVPGQGSNPDARSGVERTNHEATAPPYLLLYILLKSCLCCCSLATLAAQQIVLTTSSIALDITLIM